MGGWRAVAGLGMKGTGEEAGRDYKTTAIRADAAPEKR